MAHLENLHDPIRFAEAQLEVALARNRMLQAEIDEHLSTIAKQAETIWRLSRREGGITSDQAMGREDVVAICNELPLILSLDSRKARAEQLVNADLALRKELAQAQARIKELDGLLIHEYIPLPDLERERRLRCMAEENLSEKLVKIEQLEGEIEGYEESIKELAQAQTKWRECQREVNEALDRNNKTGEELEQVTQERDALRTRLEESEKAATMSRGPSPLCARR